MVLVPWLAATEPNIISKKKGQRVTLSLLTGWKGMERLGISAAAP